MVKVVVDQNTCIGCGACASVCPGTFEIIDGKARVKKADIKKITCEKEAVDSCPVSAITIK